LEVSPTFEEEEKKKKTNENSTLIRILRNKYWKTSHSSVNSDKSTRYKIPSYNKKGKHKNQEP